MVIRLYGAGLEGVDAFPVDVEVDLVRQGLPGFTLVGLAEAAVREARERVFSALRACGFRLPPSRITVNLAPAGRRKSGTAFDLPLALGLLAASGQIPVEALQGRVFAGELSLSGALRPVPGMLPLAIMARQLGLANDTERRVQLLIDREVYNAPYFSCHPCICTSSLKLRTRDVLTKLLPHTGHTPRIVDLPDTITAVEEGAFASGITVNYNSNVNGGNTPGDSKPDDSKPDDNKPADNKPNNGGSGTTTGAP